MAELEKVFRMNSALLHLINSGRFLLFNEYALPEGYRQVLAAKAGTANL